MYKIVTNGVLRLADNVFISNGNTNNPDWLEFVAWCDAGGVPLLDSVPLESLKQNKITEINVACEQAICAGFQSNALGEIHSYDSQIEDQINLIGAVIAAGGGVSVEYKCYNADGIKEWHIHTPQQMQQVYMDGMIYKVTQLKTASYLKGLAEAATTEAELDTIVWNT